MKNAVTKYETDETLQVVTKQYVLTYCGTIHAYCGIIPTPLGGIIAKFLTNNSY